MVHSFTELVAHVGHQVVVVTYGARGRDAAAAENVSVECETCSTVLLDFDNDDTQPNAGNAGCDACGTDDRVAGGTVCAHCGLAALVKALLVLMRDPNRRAWMVEHDPTALRQAQDALVHVGSGNRLRTGHRPRRGPAGRDLCE